MFIDLDRFKEVNDTLGHQVGDKLLIEAARRIVDCVRDTDTVARQGGDEFTVLLPGLSEQSAIERIARNDHQDPRPALHPGCVTMALRLRQHRYHPLPPGRRQRGHILKNADQAMYHAKEEGRNRYSYFSPAMQAQAQAAPALGQGAAHAPCATRSYCLYYQPILQLASGTSLQGRSPAALGASGAGVGSRPRSSSRLPKNWA